ncbi:dienelactone hydrolase family protein [Anaerolinea thermolimosa]|nr:dienelactone hydrolase family protein [Anaerolinea thermolimosa]
MMNIFQHYLATEFAEEYQEGRMTRRQALQMIISVTGSATIAQALLAACTPASEAMENPSSENTLPPSPAPGSTLPAQTPSPASAGSEPTSSFIPHGTVSPDDPSIQAGKIEFQSSDQASIQGYLARPRSSGTHAVVLVCHENRGLTPHIQDVVRRLAKAGYVALAVDLLSRAGGTPALETDQVPGILGNTPPDQFVDDFRSGWEFLASIPEADRHRVGMTGFCFGGGVTWRAATRFSELRAAVPFYGPHPPVEDVPGIQAAVLAIYGGNDSRINAGIPVIEEAMRRHGKIFEKIVFEGADHAFFNDTSPRYHAEAAAEAWRQMLRWFDRYLH